jgi:hypothetical protein
MASKTFGSVELGQIPAESALTPAEKSSWVLAVQRLVCHSQGSRR